RKRGLIATARGRHGGIRIARPAQEINIGALVRATEEDFALVECLQGGGGACVISPSCRLKGMFGEALAAYLAVLDKYTLADIVGNRAALGPLLGIDLKAA
ncbi:Rrf2 family transcriptional regulator, partial [Rhizobiaceae sp. 2RAB30]